MGIESMLTDSLKIVTIDPEMAECWLRTSKYRGQRPLMNSRVKRYSEEMKRGEWGLSESAVVIGVRSTGDHLLNGQHRLTAIVTSNLSQKFYVHRRVFESDHEMDLAYALMDRGAVRSASHAIHALELSAVLGVPDEIIRYADSAIRLAADDFAGTQTLIKTSSVLSSPQAKETMLLAWKNEIFAYHHAILGAHKNVQRWFLRSPVMAVGLITYRFTPEKASEFWYRVAQNNCLVPDTAEHKLYSFLAANLIERKGGQATYSRAVANAWNAYFEDRPLRYLQSGQHITIKGTPWDRRADRDAEIDTLTVLGLRG